MNTGKSKRLNTKGLSKFVYYVSTFDGSPCAICFIQPLCKRSYMDNSACDILTDFIADYVEGKENDNKD